MAPPQDDVPSLQVTSPEDTGRPETPRTPRTPATPRAASRSRSPPATTYAPINRSPPPVRPRFNTVSSASSSRPSIRIRRFPSYSSASQTNLPTASGAIASDNDAVDNDFGGGRRRSTSEPQRLPLIAHDDPRRQGYMPNITEGTSTSQVASPPPEQQSTPQEPPTLKKRSLSRLFRNRPDDDTAPNQGDQEYHSTLVDYLDLVDPEVSTLNTLTNVQNSLFVPDLGWILNRRPTYTLTRRPTDAEPPDQPREETIVEEPDAEAEAGDRPPLNRNQTLASITSRVSASHYAVLPHGVALDGWSSEDRKELNDHVRHMLHSKRSRFKRGMKGFGQYVRKPLGFFVTLYATLITLFGLAWVLFLIGWINVGGRKDYIVNVIDNIMVALFAIMGDGLAPFRAVDTYHMCFIAHYHHLTWRLRREKALPKLHNQNDLPPLPPSDTDLEAGGKEEEEEFSVLSEKQQKRLVYHQNKFAKSHTFYKPHETTTHHAFPLRLLVTIVVLLDCHSLLQIALGTCTWSISYHTRPFALTTVILCCSITVNITAGIFILVGDRRTRKNDVLERMHKQELTAEAIEKVQKKREHDRNHSRELLESVPPPLSPETSKPLPEDPKSMAEEREKVDTTSTSPTSSRHPTSFASRMESLNPTSPVSRIPLPLVKEESREKSGSVPATPTSSVSKKVI